MKELERLIQDETGQILGEDKKPILFKYLIPRGKIRTIIVKRPCLDISSSIGEMITKNFISLPPHANSYIISEFENEARQGKNRRDDKRDLICAIQFYYNFEGICY